MERDEIRMAGWGAGIVFALVLAVTAAPVAWAGDRPDPARTPGAINPAVTQANIHRTICVPGYSRGVRPPYAYTKALKLRQLDGDRRTWRYEEDHLIPLSLGGAPRDPRNLWPEPWHGRWGAHTKDRLELKLYHLVCAGRLPLAEARTAIARDWIAAYRRFCPARSDCPSWRELHGRE